MANTTHHYVKYTNAKKRCLVTVLKLILNDLDINFSLNWELFETTSFSRFNPLPITVTEEDMSSSNDNLPVIAYRVTIVALPTTKIEMQ